MYLKVLFRTSAFLICGLYSVAWILVTSQHCYENTKFSYRNYGVLIFALSIGVVYATKKSIEEHKIS